MAYAAGPIVSEYRLSMARLDGDIAAIERRLKAIKPPEITGGGQTSAATAGQRQIAELAKINAQVAAQQARAQAQVQQAVTGSAVAQQRLAVAQNQTAISAQRLTQAEQQTAQQLARTARETANAAAAQARAEASALRLRTAQDRAASGTADWITNLAGADQRLGALAGTANNAIGAVGALGGAFAAVAAVGGAIDFARTGASIDAAKQSFDSLASSAGTSGTALLKSLNDAAAGTVANTDLIKSSNTALLLLGSDVATQLPQLLAVAKASATTLGTDVGSVFDSLVTGISRGSTELIDNAGITVKAAEAYDSYAASIGKSADALSASEKQQAILNAVLTSGQTIIAQTAGAGETSAQSFQRAEASLANLTATAQVAAANIGAPLAGAFATAAQGADQFIQRLSGQGNAFTQQADQVAAAAPTYAAYRAQIDGTNAAIDAQILRQQGLLNAIVGVAPGLSGAITGLLQYTTQTQALSESQFLYAQALVAQGASQDAAIAKAEAHGAALATLETAVATSGGALDGFQARLAAAASASEGNLQAVNSLVTQYAAGQITIEQLAAVLAGLEQSTIAGAAAAEAGAASAQNMATGDIARANAAATAAAATRDAAIAGNQSAIASLEQAAAAEQAALKHDQLDQAIRAAATAGGDAEAAAARIAGQFNGVETPAVLNLIKLHRELAAARAGAASAANVSAALTDARAGERNPSNDPSRAAFLEKMAGNRLRYEQEQARLAARTAKTGGGGGGGGGAKSPAVKAAEKQQSEIARLDEQRIQLAQDTQRRLEELEADHGENLLDIQRQYAQKQLQAERSLRVSSLNSRADFYDALTQSSPEIGKAAADGLAAAYEAAFAKAQEFAQNGQAQLGQSFLQLRQQQISAELQQQQALAKAKAQGDQAEVNRLTQIGALRAAAREEELKQLLEGGDANVAAKDDALAAEQARFAEQTAQITGASADKATKLAADEAKIRGEVVQTNAALAEQLRLSQQLGGARPATGAGLPQAQAAAIAPAPAAPAAGVASPTPLTPGQGQGPVLVTDPALAAQFATLDATVARIAGTVEAQQGILAAIANSTADTVRKIGATRSGA